MAGEKRAIEGDGVVDGVVLDRAVVYNPERTTARRRRIAARDVQQEVDRYKKALATVKRRLRSDKKKVSDQLGSSEAGIIESHLQITMDPFFNDEVPLLIERQRRNAEWVLTDGLTRLLKGFRNIDNIYFKERARDIEDVTLRVIGRLTGREGHAELRDARGILVVQELIPSMISYIDTGAVRGMVSEMGSETSHATILAKSLGIPVVINAKGATRGIENGQRIILDGGAGRIILDPDRKLVQKYEKIIDDYARYRREIEKTVSLPALTRDDVRITLNANIEIVPGAHLALHYGAEGIGLFRTELPFLIQNRILTEEEQFGIYRSLLRQFEGKSVTIRTLDMGGDKFFPFQEDVNYLEANPFLGLRSIRMCLMNPEIMRTQVRALLRASRYGKIKVLLPMISSCEEMEQALSLIEEEKTQARAGDVPFDENIEIGAMIEIPSAALLARHMIDYCSFFSIGTNDLVQYTLAVDRTNEKVASYYVPENPSVLKLIEMTARAAKEAGKVCAVCGELAGDPLFTPFFLGVGITELSMEAQLIPVIKEVIRSMNLSDAADLSARVLASSRSEEIKAHLGDFHRSLGLDEG